MKIKITSDCHLTQTVIKNIKTAYAYAKENGFDLTNERGVKVNTMTIFANRVERQKSLGYNRYYTEKTPFTVVIEDEVAHIENKAAIIKSEAAPIKTTQQETLNETVIENNNEPTKTNEINLTLNKVCDDTWELTGSGKIIASFYRLGNKTNGFYWSVMGVKFTYLHPAIEYIRIAYENTEKERNKNATVIIGNLESHLSQDETHKVVQFENGKYGIEEIKTGFLKSAGCSKEAAIKYHKVLTQRSKIVINSGDVLYP